MSKLILVIIMVIASHDSADSSRLCKWTNWGKFCLEISVPDFTDQNRNYDQKMINFGIRNTKLWGFWLSYFYILLLLDSCLLLTYRRNVFDWLTLVNLPEKCLWLAASSRGAIRSSWALFIWDHSLWVRKWKIISFEITYQSVHLIIIFPRTLKKPKGIKN